MTSWFVTGATGLLGSNVGFELASKMNIFGGCRNPQKLPGYSEVTQIDLLDPIEIGRTLDRIQPRVVLHAAALASHEACEQNSELAFQINTHAAGLVAQLCARRGIGLIYISTDAVFGGYGRNYSEIDETAPFSVYGMSKLAGEAEVLSWHPGPLIIRTNFFGWSLSNRRSILEFFVNSLRNHTIVNGYTNFVVTSIYVRDLVRNIFDVYASGYRGIINIASQDALSKYEFGLQIASAFELPSRLIMPVEASSEVGAMSRSRNLSLSTQKLESLLGRQAPSQEMGVGRAHREELQIKRSFEE